jgi:ABC-type multidrug transport system ATPase subunit
MGEAALRVEGLSVHLGGQPILQDITFEIRAGERLGLIGPNGAGKTTLLETLAGLLPAQGRIQRHVPLFYLPDGITPWEDLRVSELLGCFQRLHRREAAACGSLSLALDLAPVQGKRMRELSKGNRKRTLLALAFLTRAPVLLLDEPFDGLDLHQARQAMLLIQAQQAQGRTLLLSIHELRQAEGFCDRLLLLVGGRLALAGTLEELQADTGTAGGLEEVFLALR